MQLLFVNAQYKKSFKLVSIVKSQALLPCLGAQACTRVLHTMISAKWIIRQSRRNTDHSTEKG